MTISVRVCAYLSINVCASRARYREHPLPTPREGSEGICGMMRIDIFRNSVALAVQLQLLLMQDAADAAAAATAAVAYVSQWSSGQSHTR